MIKDKLPLHKQIRIARHIARIRFNMKRIQFCEKKIKHHKMFVEKLGGNIEDYKL